MATYYPKIELRTRVTPLGVKVSTHPSLYERPVSNREIIRIDLLQFLLSFLNQTVDSCLTLQDIKDNRSILIELLKGEGTDHQFQSALRVLCRNLEAMEEYLLWAIYFEDNTKPLVSRVIHPLRRLLDASVDEVHKSLSHVRSVKFLMLHEEQLYLSIPKGVSPAVAYEYHKVE